MTATTAAIAAYSIFFYFAASASIAAAVSPDIACGAATVAGAGTAGGTAAGAACTGDLHAAQNFARSSTGLPQCVQYFKIFLPAMASHATPATHYP